MKVWRNSLIIGDSSALVTLAIADKLDIVEKLFGNLYVPEAVYKELTKIEKPYSSKLKSFLKGRVKNVNLKIEKLGLGAGELEAIILYKELNADILLIDDARAKKFALLNDIKVIGSLGILIKAKENGYISEIKPLLEKIKKSGIYLTDYIINQVLEICNES